MNPAPLFMIERLDILSGEGIEGDFNKLGIESSFSPKELRKSKELLDSNPILLLQWAIMVESENAKKSGAAGICGI